jgi:uridine kinase
MKNTINDITQINKLATEAPYEFATKVENQYDSIIKSVAERICQNPDQTKLIMLSGPSASGKTTSSRKLHKDLSDRGVEAITISLDDFFKCRFDVPLLPNGKCDFESTAALDLPLLHQCLKNLLDKGQTELPSFDFKTGKPSPFTHKIELKENGVAIVEGIHALSDVITEKLPQNRYLKIYVRVVKSVYQNDEKVLTNRDVRFIRRLLRDFRYRGSSPENTFNMWPQVCRGENLYIKPFLKKADITIDSFLPYEMCIYKDSAIELLEQVDVNSVFSRKSNELISALKLFEPIDKNAAPNTSLIREFIGGSIYFGNIK